MIIDLRSDTVTRPSKPMLEAMFNAKVGDDVFGEDPTVKELEEKTAAMFGMETALFCPSGTMTNQIAIHVHTDALDEVVCDRLSHIYQYEVGGYAFNSRIGIKLLEGDRGRITAVQVENSINPDHDWLPVTKLVCIENTSNKGGGSCYALQEMQAISAACKSRGLRLHLDGARLFNALTATGNKPEALHGLFDSISLCLSKGLGAPVGSVLTGNKDFIKKARRVRKVMGGGMRQAGYLAAACIYALENNIERIAEDHARAAAIGEVLSETTYVDSLMPVDTNIVIASLKPEFSPDIFINKLAASNIFAVPFGGQTVRFITHLDFTDGMLEVVKQTLKHLSL